MGKLIKIVLLIILGCNGFISNAQTYDKNIADYILKVEHPYTFLQRIEQIGVKEAGRKGLDSAYLWLKKIIEQKGYTTTTQNILFNQDTLKNIEFIKKGTSDSCIVIGAHYDSKIGPGVNDNGTGDFALYQIAVLLKNITTKYTLRFVYFSGEEINYQGSKHYVKTLNKDSVKIKFMLNLDQLGGTLGYDNTGVKCERDEVSARKAESNLLAVAMTKIYNLYTNLNPIITPAYLSDYLAFRDSGYLITGVYQYSDFPYIHSEGDLLQYMEFNSLISSVKGALAYVLYFSGAEVPAGINTKTGQDHVVNVYYTNKQLVINSSSNYSVTIYDGLGREILYTNSFKSGKTVSLNELKTGIYFALVKTEKGITYNKFLVEP